MSAEIVLIIVGVSCILIAIADSISINGSSLGLLNTKLRIPLGILGVILIMYGGFSYGAVHQPGQIEKAVVGNKIQYNLPVEQVKVLSPLQGDSVSCRILTMGVYPEKHDKDIWVLLKPSDQKYYPQSDHTNTSYKRNGKWQVITRFGGDKAEMYEVIVYEADSSASRYFSTTIQNWKDMLSYPGLTEDQLPDSASEVDRITVYLEEHCRGVF